MSVELNTGSVDTIIKGMNVYAERLKVALLIITKTVAAKMEEWAKQNASWTDRTGNARQGLKGEAYWEDAKTLVCAMSHNVEYGVWLELANERKYAILEQAIDQHKNELMAQWKKLVSK